MNNLTDKYIFIVDFTKENPQNEEQMIVSTKYYPGGTVLLCKPELRKTVVSWNNTRYVDSSYKFGMEHDLLVWDNPENNKPFYIATSFDVEQFGKTIMKI